MTGTPIYVAPHAIDRVRKHGLRTLPINLREYAASAPDLALVVGSRYMLVGREPPHDWRGAFIGGTVDIRITAIEDDRFAFDVLEPVPCSSPPKAEGK